MSARSVAFLLIFGLALLVFAAFLFSAPCAKPSAAIISRISAANPICRFFIIILPGVIWVMDQESACENRKLLLRQQRPLRLSRKSVLELLENRLNLNPMATHYSTA